MVHHSGRSAGYGARKGQVEDVQLAVLLGLAALWIAVLLPDFLRRRGTRRSGDSISDFSRHLSVLERSNPVTESSRSGRRIGAIRRPSSNVIPFSPRGETAPAPAATYRSASATATATAAVASPVTRRPAVAPSASPARSPRPAAALPTAPTTKSAAQRRRQDVIVALGAAALLSFLATLAFGGAVLVLHLMIDLALVGYLAMVLRTTRRPSARSNVAYLAPQASVVTTPVRARSTAAR
jgi:hypothetical protein